MFTSKLWVFLIDSLSTSTTETHTVSPGSSADVHEIQSRIKELLNKYSSGVRLSKMPQVYQEMFWEDLSTEVLYQLENWPHVCTVSIEPFLWKMPVPYKFPSVHLPNVMLYVPAFPFMLCSSDKNLQLPPPHSQIVTMPFETAENHCWWTGVLKKEGQPLWFSGASACGCHLLTCHL